MQTFHFDLSTKSVAPVLNVKQGDVGRKFRAVITDGGAAYDIPAGSRFSVWFSGPSGAGNYSAIGDRSAFAVDGSTVTVELIAQMLVNAGTGALCLVLTAGDGTQLGLWNMVYAVEHVPGMGSKAAEDYYTALSELARQAIEAAETFETDPTLSASGKAADAAAVGAGLAGKAPAGYGLGSTCKTVDDWNNAKDNGFYRSNTNGLVGGYCHGYVVKGDGNITQVAFANSGVIHAIRSSTDWGNTWGEWEFVNAGMTLGREYRTTERWNGKPVYTKLINVGALPNAANTTVSGALPSNITPISVYGIGLDNAGGVAIPSMHIMVTAHRTGGGIYIATDANYSSVTGYLAVKYTKD